MAKENFIKKVKDNSAPEFNKENNVFTQWEKVGDEFYGRDPRQTKLRKEDVYAEVYAQMSLDELLSEMQVAESDKIKSRKNMLEGVLFAVAGAVAGAALAGVAYLGFGMVENTNATLEILGEFLSKVGVYGGGVAGAYSVGNIGKAIYNAIKHSKNADKIEEIKEDLAIKDAVSSRQTEKFGKEASSIKKEEEENNNALRNKSRANIARYLESGGNTESISVFRNDEKTGGR